MDWDQLYLSCPASSHTTSFLAGVASHISHHASSIVNVAIVWYLAQLNQVTRQLTLRKIANWMSKKLLKTWHFFQKNCQKLLFFSTILTIAILWKKTTTFGNCLKNVKFWANFWHSNGSFPEGQVRMVNGPLSISLLSLSPEILARCSTHNSASGLTGSTGQATTTTFPAFSAGSYTKTYVTSADSALSTQTGSRSCAMKTVLLTLTSTPKTCIGSLNWTTRRESLTTWKRWPPHTEMATWVARSLFIGTTRSPPWINGGKALSSPLSLL